MISSFSASQMEAIRCTSRSCLVLAGPGSGKTTVLTEHILFLVTEQKIPPSQILVLTFSREAAAQMRRRFFSHDIPFGDVTFGTFHAFFFGVLRKYCSEQIRLIDPSERSELISRLTKRFYPDPLNRPLPEEVEAAVSGMSMSEAVFFRTAVTQDPDLEMKEDVLRDPGLVKIGDLYRQYLEENGLTDYDGILVRACRRLLEDPGLRGKLREKYRYYVIDELQDINALQYSSVRLLSDGMSIFAVGDDDQSIYSFRGSDPGTMIRFLEDHPGCRLIRLEDNYRCREEVVKAAQAVIRESPLGIRKMNRAFRSGGSVRIIPCEDEREQTEVLLGLLRTDRQGRSTADTGRSRKSTAVVCRTRRQIRSVCRAAEESGLMGRASQCAASPAGPDPLVRRACEAVSEDMEAYLTLSEGMRRGVIKRDAFLRILNRPGRFLPRSVVCKEKEFAADKMLLSLPAGDPFAEVLAETVRDLGRLTHMSPRLFFSYIADTMGYRQFAAAEYGESAAEALALIGRTAEKTSTGSEWLQLLKEGFRSAQTGNPKVSAEENDTGGLRIMTMHAAKGLEFDRVIIPGLNDGIIPGRRCTSSAAVEEERRLLYVAMTRAKEELYLLYVSGTGYSPRLPSRFLIPLGVRT